MLRIAFILAVCCTTSFVTVGDAPLSYLLESNSTIKVHGTSTLHDWTMHMEKVSGEATMDIDAESGLDISKVYVRLKVTDFKSEWSQMDKNTYEALEEEDHPYITYNLTRVNAVTPQGGNKYQVDASGSLTIAGTTRTIRMKSTVQVNSDGTLRITGSHAMKMTDFNVDPPTAMFGTITTGNDITIEFDTKFNTRNQ